MRHQARTVARILAAIGGRTARRGEPGGAPRCRAYAVGDQSAACRSGALLVEYRGVYRVGHRAPSREARYLAAVKACGRGAVLSGRAAAHLHGLIKGRHHRPR